MCVYSNLTCHNTCQMFESLHNGPKMLEKNKSWQLFLAIVILFAKIFPNESFRFNKGNTGFDVHYI